MAVTINGSGTVTGISAGGLPDGCVVTADVADGAITQQKRSEQLTLATAQDSTSGTSIDFTGIPSWVKRVTIMFNGVSTNGTSPIQVQLGDSGGIETSGYVGGNWTITGANACNLATFSTGFAPIGNDTTETRHGILNLFNSSSNNWLANGMFYNAGTEDIGGVAGEKATSSTLDRIRITTVNGTDTFDAGSINIMYE